MSIVSISSSTASFAFANQALSGKASSFASRLMAPAGGQNDSSQQPLAMKDMQSLLLARSQASAVKDALRNLKLQTAVGDGNTSSHEAVSGAGIYVDQAVMQDLATTSPSVINGTVDLSSATQLSTSGTTFSATFSLALADGTSATITLKHGNGASGDEIDVDNGTKVKIKNGVTVSDALVSALNSVDGVTASENANGTLQISAANQAFTLTDGALTPLTALGLTPGTYSPATSYSSVQVGTNHLQVGSQETVVTVDPGDPAGGATAGIGTALAQLAKATGAGVSPLLRGGSARLQALGGSIQGSDLTISGLDLANVSSLDPKRAGELIDAAIAKVDNLISKLEKTASRALRVALTTLQQGPQSAKSFKAVQDGEKLARQLANGTYSGTSPGALVSRVA